MTDFSDYNISFNSLIKRYKIAQDKLKKEVYQLAANSQAMNPAEFLMLQFTMSQVTQVGESLSNVIAQVNSIINSTVRNQKSQ